jgi:hypothetical protein
MPEITKSGFVLKELPEGIEKASDDSLWAVASVEKADEDDDIVRVDGLDTSMHREHSPIKILAQHLRKLPDGSPPIIGKVEEFRKANIGKGKDASKALLFRMTFAPTDLAKKYKQLFDAGYMESFSIGASVLESKPLKEKGYDYTKTKLREISAVTIPANADATVMRALEEKLGDQLDRNSELSVSLEHILSALAENKSITETVLKRLDDIESAIVAKSEEGSLTGDRTEEPAVEEVNWDALLSHLKSLSKPR